MALISFFGAKGAPGVTTTAMLTAALWPRPTILVDADNAGGDVGLRLLSETGAALLPKPGLLTLLPLSRHGLMPSVVLEHTQTALGGQPVLVGLESPVQAEAANALWPAMAQGFAQLPSTDVVIDAGRLLGKGSQISLIQHSDLAIGVIRAEAASVVHMRRRMRWLMEHLTPMGAEAPMLGLVCVEQVSRQGEAADAIAAIRDDVAGLMQVGQVALDSKGVRMFHGEPVDRPERQMIVRSGRTLVEQLAAVVAADEGQEAAANPTPNLPATPGTPARQRSGDSAAALDQVGDDVTEPEAGSPDDQDQESPTTRTGSRQPSRRRSLIRRRSEG